VDDEPEADEPEAEEEPAEEIEKLELPKTDSWGLPLNETMPKRRRAPLTKAQKIEYARQAQEMGMDRLEAEPWQYALLASMGVEIQDGLSKIKFREVFERLREPIEHVVYDCLTYESWAGMYAGVADAPERLIHTPWTLTELSPGQFGKLRYHGIDPAKAKCRRDASLLLDAHLKAETLKGRLLKDISRARNDDDLSGIGKDLKLIEDVLEKRIWLGLVEAGRERRKQLGRTGGIPE
jgi:hypothetical protein